MNKAKNKQLLRDAVLSQRREISSAQRWSNDNAITRILLSQSIWGEKQRVHSYLPIKSQYEVEAIDCIARLIDGGHELWTSYLPKNQSGDGFCRLSSTTQFKVGRYSIPLPQEKVEKVCHPTVIIVPCIAVDKQGNRLGYGSGWYDAFLSQHKEALRIGLVYDQFLHNSIPHNEFDQQLDMIVTEKQVIFCERKI